MPRILPADYSSRTARFDGANRMMAAWHSTDPNEYRFIYDTAGERAARYRTVAGQLQSVTFSIRDEQANVLSHIDWIPQGNPEDPDQGH